MGGESLPSTSSMESLHDKTSGTESELVRIASAQLFLLDGQESVRMGAGDFALIMIVQATSNLATLVAQVAEFQWPVGKDGPVLKIARFRYTFSIPGLQYGLILPDTTPREHIQQFETYMRKYGTYVKMPEISHAAGVTDLRLWSAAGIPTDEEEGARYWTAVADDVENYSTKLARQISSGSSAAASSIIKGSEWATWGIKRGASFVKSNLNPASNNDGEISPRMRKRMEQARRMSAVAKLLSRTVLKGALSVTGHVANFLGTAITGTPPMRAFLRSDSRREVAIASVDAFAKVVEAVETAGKSLAVTTGTVGTDIMQYKFGQDVGQVTQDGMGVMGNMIDSVWTLNKVGLRMLWHATAATTFSANRAGGSSSRSPSSRSAASHSPSGSRSMDALSSARQYDSSPSFSTQSLARHLSLGRTISLSPPRSPQEEVLQTAQFFPSPGPVRSQSQTYPIVTSSAYMPQHAVQMPAAYAAYYPSNPNSPFQLYARPPVSPQIQPFFPYMEGPQSQ